MALDKYAQLKVAGNILGFTMLDFANELGTYPQVVKSVCEGHTTSARISKAVDAKIKQAERAWDAHRKKKATERSIPATA